jgi:FkbM family methyltransferase
MVVIPSFTAATRAVYFAWPDHPHTLVWSRLLTRGDTFIDVGANAGLYSVLAHSLGCNVVAFEPDPAAFQLLRLNMRANGSANWRLWRAACGNYDGEANLSTGRGAENALLEDSPPGVPTGRSVRVVRLDSVVGHGGRIDGMKIDVEGHEQQVLEGADALLRHARIASMQLEWNDAGTPAARDAVHSLLTGHGYAFFRPTVKGALRRIQGRPSSGSDVFALSREAVGKLGDGHTLP